jgi:hypothetical protein
MNYVKCRRNKMRLGKKMFMLCYYSLLDKGVDWDEGVGYRVSGRTLYRWRPGI